MTDKERLEEIEKNLDPLGYGMGGHLISVNDIHWLVKYAKEQAERVHELEEENKRIRQMKYHEAYEQGKFDTNMKVWYEVPKLEQQIKRYREALTYYAEESNYDYDVKVDSIGYIGDQSDMKFYRLDSAILNDRGEKARQALEGESDA